MEYTNRYFMKGLMGTDSKYNDLIKGLKGIVEYINRIMDNKKIKN